MVDEVAQAVDALRRPGLVVLTGPPGAGRTTLLRRLTAAAGGSAHTGGGLAALRGVPALALSRAVRARLPADDVHLLAEAVRSRVRGALLVLDDLHHADDVTLAALPLLARHCRVLAALRTPHRHDDTALRAAATVWLTVPPLDGSAATDLARRHAPRLDATALAAVVARAGGNPLTVTALARQAAAGRTGVGDTGQVAYAVASALADLPRAARTALAALGLLGAPAPAGLLGPGAAALQQAGLVTAGPDGLLTAASTFVAETAAGLLDDTARADLHRSLAALTPPEQAARHLAAAGDPAGAYRTAVRAADLTTGAHRAQLLLFACAQDTTVDVPVRLAAATAALAAGRAGDAAAVLRPALSNPVLGARAAVLCGEALLQDGRPDAARDTVRPVSDTADAEVTAARDRVLLLADLADDPWAARDRAEKVTARHPRPPAPVAAALAAVRAHHRTPGWDDALTDAAAGTDPVIARWSAWLLVETLAADGRLTDAADAARHAAAGCGTDYGWRIRFTAAADWVLALHGGDGDAVQRHAADLTDRAAPADAHGYAVAAAALIEADTGLLAAAQARLAAADTEHPATAWVTRETAWLDGRPDRAGGAPLDTDGLLAGLHAITARWAGHDLGTATSAPIPTGLPAAARRTLTAWLTGTGFTAAADSWQPVAARERIRCLLAAGDLDTDPQRAVAALLQAEQLADTAGLSVLAGRARRGLRRHRVHRDVRSPRAGHTLTRRETEVLRLVAAGEPTRRIAGQLGISGETVDTHIRAGMRKLGARTRTEAAARLVAAGQDRQR